MIAKSRCKFRVSSVTDYGHSSKKISLTAQYDPKTSPEDASFSTATPSGSMEFQLNNPVLDGFFVPGREFYIDLIPVELDSK